MKKQVLDSSVEAYHSDKMHQRDLTERLLDYARKTKRFTARMACDALGSHQMVKGHYQFVPIQAATMSGIIKPLVGEENGKGILIREQTKFPCEITGNRVYWLSYRNYTGQQSLFN